MTRSSILNKLLSMFHDPLYLEIGVNRGVTFSEITASQKVAVDPSFAFDVEKAAEKQPNAKFHQVSSDDFFSETAGTYKKFHVIFIDGLHTFEQTS